MNLLIIGVGAKSDVNSRKTKIQIQKISVYLSVIIEFRLLIVLISYLKI